MAIRLTDEEWLEIIHEADSFEGTIKEFCRFKGVNDKTFYLKRKLLHQEIVNDETSIRPVKIINEDNNSKNNTSVTVNGNILTFANNINNDALLSIIMGLRNDIF